MSNSGQPIEWNRLLLEGVVIVASILLAFAIDAWWDERQDRQAESNQLLSIAAEIESNAERIREKLDVLAVADEAAKKFISWAGPEPRPVEQKELADTFLQMYGIGAFALLRGASERYLSGGRINTVRHDNVRKAIADWYAAGDDLERQYAWLREAHSILGSYLNDAVPRLSLETSLPLVRDIQGSSFPFNQLDLLSDPRFENRVYLYLIRLRFVQAQAADLVDHQAQLLDLIQSAAEN
jgi:hypothetical protein